MVNNNTTNASFSVDVSYAPKQTIADINQSFLQTQESQKSAISSVFNFGKTPSTPFQPNLSNPNLLFIEILQDRLKKPYLKLNWESERQDIDSGQVTGFYVFRLLLPDTQAITHKNTIEVTSVIVDKLGNSIKKDALPLSYLNNNLANEQQFTTYVSSSVSVVQSDYVKIATINYSDYLKQQSNKLVSVTDRNIIQMSFEDKDIKYFQTYEYYIAYVTKVSLLVRPKSSTIVVTVDKNITPAPPISFLSKQVSEKEVYLSLTVNPSDDVGSYIIFKKAQNEISFKKVLESKINSNTSVILDKSIEYGKSYKYRVFLQDIFLN